MIIKTEAIIKIRRLWVLSLQVKSPYLDGPHHSNIQWELIKKDPRVFVYKP